MGAGHCLEVGCSRIMVYVPWVSGQIGYANGCPSFITFIACLGPIELNILHLQGIISGIMAFMSSMSNYN